MSNIESAKAAIEAEIAQLHSRIASLESTLKSLSGMNGTTASTEQSPKKRGPKAKEATSQKPTVKVPKKAKAGKTSAGGNQLPFTGGDFWPNLLNDQPKSGSEILQAVIESLNFTPSKAEVQKLSQRMTFALNSLVKSGKIQDSGSGRERRFFRN